MTKQPSKNNLPPTFNELRDELAGSFADAAALAHVLHLRAKELKHSDVDALSRAITASVKRTITHRSLHSASLSH